MGENLLCLTDPGRQTSHVITSMFLHGSWMHLLGNMWFLWLFGNNIEDSMTRPRFVAFYLLCGLAAALLQVAADPESAVPMVGASGAISGVMGAYLVLFPRVRVYTLIFLGFFSQTVAVPAWAMLLYWAFLQLAGGVSQIGGSEGGVAFWAHIGGFIAGVVLVKVFVAARSRPGASQPSVAAEQRALVGGDGTSLKGASPTRPFGVASGGRHSLLEFVSGGPSTSMYRSAFTDRHTTYENQFDASALAMAPRSSGDSGVTSLG